MQGLSVFQDKKKRLLFIFLISISIKIVYFLHFKENPFFYFIHDTSDAINFDIGALNFSSGDLLASSPNNNYSPFYKYFIGFIYILVGRNLPVVWAVQLLMGTFTLLLIFLITSKLFNNRAAFISSFLYSLYGPGLMFEGILLRATILSFLGVLSLYLLIILAEKRNLIRILATGFVVSLFIQCRPNVIIVFALFLFILPNYFGNKKVIKETILLSFIVFLFFIPLLIQAKMVHGKFVFFDASGPVAILMGNNPEYPGADYLEEYRYEGDFSLSYSKTMSLLLQNFIRYPMEMLKLYLRKTYHFFNSYEFPTNYNFYVFREFSFLLKTPLSNFAVFSSLGLLGFLININKFDKLRLLNIYFIGMTLSVILFYIVSRFRIPVVPYYAVFSGCFLDRICVWYGSKKYKKILFSIATVFVFQFYLNSFPHIASSNVSIDYGNLGNAYLNIGNVEKAIVAYDKSLEIDPGNFFSRNNLGKVYAEKNQLLKAENEFTKAIKQKPNKWEFHYNLGVVYVKSKKIIKAEKMFLSAYKLAPRKPQISFSLGNLYENMELLEKSLTFYRSYVSLSKGDWRGYFFMGNVLSRLHRFEPAIEKYKKSKKLNVKHSQTLVNLGNSYSAISKPNLALREYLQALSLSPRDPIIHRNVGLLYSIKGFLDPKKAIYHLKRTLELSPDQNSAELIQKLIQKLG